MRRDPSCAQARRPDNEDQWRRGKDPSSLPHDDRFQAQAANCTECPQSFSVFEIGATDVAWASAITYIDTMQCWLYLAVILDLRSRGVVGWSMSQSLEATSCSMRCGWPSRAEGPSAACSTTLIAAASMTSFSNYFVTMERSAA